MTTKADPGKASSRFTAWLSASERNLVFQEARQRNMSANFVIRLAIRSFFGMSDEQSQLLHVTTDTSTVKELQT